MYHRDCCFLILVLITFRWLYAYIYYYHSTSPWFFCNVFFFLLLRLCLGHYTNKWMHLCDCGLVSGCKSSKHKWSELVRDKRHIVWSFVRWRQRKWEIGRCKSNWGTWGGKGGCMSVWFMDTFWSELIAATEPTCCISEPRHSPSSQARGMSDL